jgi:hypothetical protein
VDLCQDPIDGILVLHENHLQVGFVSVGMEAAAAADE